MAITPVTTTKTVVLKPGEKFTLPPNSTVLSISGPLVSSCASELPTPEPLACYYFQWEIQDVSDENSDAWNTAILDYLTIGTTQYPLNTSGRLDEDGGDGILFSALTAAGYSNIHIPPVSLLGDRGKWSACFKTTYSIASKSFLKMHSSDNTYAQMPALLLSTSIAPPCACS